MIRPDLVELVGPALASALAGKGYDTLTPVQEAVLDPALAGRDLRITSQTGSGKTVAIGFVVRDLVEGRAPARGSGAARPHVLILAPTRELAQQVADELSWLYAPLKARVVAITGGVGYADQKRALGSDPAVVVATPGRLRDALEGMKIDPAALGAVVLDEADSMLDLGFREDLDAILALLPAERRSHLVSATFSRDVVSLADRFQRDAVHVEGTRLGEAHADIEHVVHIVEPGQRVDALVNLLLSDEDAKSLVFVRTRADVARIAGELAEAGFVVRALSGEMEQPERDRALAAFRGGGVQALVATDVAARGIDVRDIARVIQIEPPSDVETYTHRSGRTGRAGKHGTSVLFVAPSHYAAIARGLGRAGIPHRVEPIPGAEVIQRAREERLVAWLSREGQREAIDPHAVSIAERVVAGEHRVSAVARLIEKAGLHGPTRPRDVRDVRAAAPREDRAPRPRGASDGKRAAADRRAWVTFMLTWGERQGADARRLLAIVCRRGDIRGEDVGAIRIDAAHSFVDIAADVADRFEARAAEPDPRDPRVRITRSPGAHAGSGERPRGPGASSRDRPRGPGAAAGERPRGHFTGAGEPPRGPAHGDHRAPRTMPPPVRDATVEPEAHRPKGVRRIVTPARPAAPAPRRSPAKDGHARPPARHTKPTR
jgi:ATP-dependent RNA helicase DeaD